MNAVTIDSTWLTNNGPPPYLLNAANTVYTLGVDVNVTPTEPTGVATLSSGKVTGVTVTQGSDFDPGNPPAVSFAAPPSVQATATATVGSGAVTAINVGTTGNGYDPASPPAVTIGGPGTGATAHAVVGANGGISNVVVDNGGTGYASAPTVTIAAPAPVTATGVGTVKENGDVAVKITNQGKGYGNTPPTVTFSGGKIWFTGEVFRFPDADGTGRNPAEIVLVKNGHSIKVNGETCPQVCDAHLYRRTSEYTVRSSANEVRHFGGTYSDGNTQKDVIPRSGGAESYEYPALFNESYFADTK